LPSDQVTVDVEIGTARDEQTDSLVLVAQGRQMQRSGLWEATAGQRIDEVRACVEVLPQRVNVSRLRRTGDALHRLQFGAGANRSALNLARKHFDGLIRRSLAIWWMVRPSRSGVAGSKPEAKARRTASCLRRERRRTRGCVRLGVD
jgi:hypothetical protein